MKVKLAHINALSLMDAPALLQKIVDVTKERSFYHIVLLDFDLFIKSRFNKKLLSVINQADLVIPKGSLMAWIVKSLSPCPIVYEQKEYPDVLPVGNEEDTLSAELLTDNIKGVYESSNLSLLLIRRFAKEDVGFFLLGDKSSNMIKAVRHIKMSFPQIKIMGSHTASQFKKHTSEIMLKLKKVAPHLLIVDIKKTKQEEWIHSLQKELPSTICIGMHREISMYAGKRKGFMGLLDRFFKIKWLFIFRFSYFMILFFLYKTFLKKEIQCLE